MIAAGRDPRGRLLVLVDGAVWPWGAFVAGRRTALVLPATAARATTEILAALVARDILEAFAAAEGAA